MKKISFYLLIFVLHSGLKMPSSNLLNKQYSFVNILHIPNKSYILSGNNWRLSDKYFISLKYVKKMAVKHDTICIFDDHPFIEDFEIKHSFNNGIKASYQRSLFIDSLKNIFSPNKCLKIYSTGPTKKKEYNKVICLLNEQFDKQIRMHLSDKSIVEYFNKLKSILNEKNKNKIEKLTTINSFMDQNVLKINSLKYSISQMNLLVKSCLSNFGANNFSIANNLKSNGSIFINANFKSNLKNGINVIYSNGYKSDIKKLSKYIDKKDLNKLLDFSIKNSLSTLHSKQIKKLVILKPNLKLDYITFYP